MCADLPYALPMIQLPSVLALMKQDPFCGGHMTQYSQDLLNRAQTAIEIANVIEYEAEKLTPKEMKLKLQELVEAITLVNAEVRRVQHEVLEQDIQIMELQGELLQIKGKPPESPYYWEHYLGE